MCSDNKNEHITLVNRRPTLTQLKGLSARKFANPLQQPRRHLLSSLVDTLLYALAHGLFHSCLDLIACRGVLFGDGNGQQRRKRLRQG